MSSLANAMATSTAVKPLRPLAGDQFYRKAHFLCPIRRKFRPMTRASSSRLPFFPIALKKSESQEASVASKESSYSLLAAVRSTYNEIVVMDTPETRILLLDSSRKFKPFALSNSVDRVIIHRE